MRTCSNCDGIAIHVAHLLQIDDMVAAGVYHLDLVANQKFVFDFHLGPAVGDTAYFAHKVAVANVRVPGFVVLVVL